jgi:hypothetical protein
VGSPDPANRDALAAGGTVICLEAEPAVIARRLAGGNGRPLLSDPNSDGGALGHRKRIAELLAQRATAYATLPHHLDTSSLTVAQTAERVMGLAFGLPDGGHRIPVGRRARGTEGEPAGNERTAADERSHAASRCPDRRGLLEQAGKRLAGVGGPPLRGDYEPHSGELLGRRPMASLGAAGRAPY